MKKDKYIVYILIDDQARVTEINSSPFLPTTDGWTEIDVGCGDKFYHAQGNYLPGPLYDAHEVPLYKYINGQIIPRTQAEIDADYILPPVIPTIDQRIADLEDAYTADKFGGAL